MYLYPLPVWDHYSSPSSFLYSNCVRDFWRTELTTSRETICTPQFCDTWFQPRLLSSLFQISRELRLQFINSPTHKLHETQATHTLYVSKFLFYCSHLIPSSSSHSKPAAAAARCIPLSCSSPALIATARASFLATAHLASIKTVRGAGCIA